MVALQAPTALPPNEAAIGGGSPAPQWAPMHGAPLPWGRCAQGILELPAQIVTILLSALLWPHATETTPVFRLLSQKGQPES